MIDLRLMIFGLRQYVGERDLIKVLERSTIFVYANWLLELELPVTITYNHNNNYNHQQLEQWLSVKILGVMINIHVKLRFQEQSEYAAQRAQQKLSP